MHKNSTSGSWQRCTVIPNKNVQLCQLTYVLFDTTLAVALSHAYLK